MRSNRYRPWAVALLALAGCAKNPHALVEAVGAPDTARDAAMPVATVRAQVHGSFADAPDRGELLAYPTRQVRRDGAYTWHRTGLSEAYALRAIADGHLRVTTPAGQLLDFQYDRHIEHPSGDWTWIGHIPGHADLQSIITFGAHAAFGSIAQPDKLPLRLTVRDGASWLVETDGAKVGGIVNSATRPQHPDFHIPPSSRAGANGTGPSMASAPATAAAGTTGSNTVDLVIGYTQGFAASNGGTSGAVTRLNYLVDVTNAAYVNSGIPANVRLVATVPVTYTDSTSNDDTLSKVTGYDSNSNAKTTPDSAFNALRAAREQYGADLVSVVRSFQEPENGGCGIAWLIGGGQSGIATSDSYFGYSVVSDGRDAGTDGKSYFCLDETLAHELGHNMGAAHDVKTAQGTDGVLQADEYGAFPYSFGFKSTTPVSPGDANSGSGTRGFYTVMAYGDTGQRIFRIFSDPRSTFCGGNACGTTTQADNARTLTQTIPTIAMFRSTVVASGHLPDSDFDGDGTSDILWRNQANGANVIWKSANATTVQAVNTLSDLSWFVAGVGDFDGDGKSDILWRNRSTGNNVVWKAGSYASSQTLAPVSDQNWVVAGVGDFDGDGSADILWRNLNTGADVIWRSGNSATMQPVATAAASWTVAGVGDFDGDGRADILWRNTGSGANAIWKSGNSATPQSVPTVANLSWSVAGVGDFNGDGSADILWHNTSGTNVIWNSGNSVSQQAVTTTSSLWAVAAVHDYNGDGKADILWRNSGNGSNVAWLSGSSSTPQAVAAVSNQQWVVAD